MAKASNSYVIHNWDYAWVETMHMAWLSMTWYTQAMPNSQNIPKAIHSTLKSIDLQ